jgi:UDP-N-acetylmuramoylalanine--D-glutamate ligase
MKLEELKNKKILIVGRGIEGNAAYKYLRKHLPNSVIDIVDQKDGNNYLDKQKNYDIAVKSPGVKPELIKIPYTTSTNIFLSNAKGKVIGVTGTKGKSTTSTLIYKMLRGSGINAYFGGNIGQSSLDFLDKLNDQSWTVLEMSSFQLQDLKIGPHIAVMLMIESEHLDYHKTFAAYIDAKRNIFRFQTPSDFAVINRDYLVSHESDIFTKGKVFNISRERKCENGSYVKDDIVWMSKDGRKEKIIDVDKIKLLGRHNLENVCAAVCAATIVGVSKASIRKVLSEFSGLEHRLEFVKDINGIRFYNDSLATIPQATIEALESLPETETLIAGGHDRGLDYLPLAQYLSNGQVKTLILFPPTGKRIWEEICKIVPEKSRPEKFDVKTMEEAVRIAIAKTLPGKICLLSPASASFGIFKDYKDRGEQFKREVLRLKSIIS